MRNKDKLDFINQIVEEAEKQCDIHVVVCCGVLEKMKLEWMQLEDGTKCMPFIYGIDQKMYRVNNCPSCGKYVRDVMI